MALYFVTVWSSASKCTLFKHQPSWSEHIKRFKMAAIIRFDLDVSKKTARWLLYNCSRPQVQNQIQIHQQNGKGLPLLCPRDDSQGALRFDPVCPSVCHALWYRVCVINSSHSFCLAWEAEARHVLLFRRRCCRHRRRRPKLSVFGSFSRQLFTQVLSRLRSISETYILLCSILRLDLLFMIH